MPSLMPTPERSLTLPIAALAAPPRGLPPVLADCLAFTQDEYLRAADQAGRPASLQGPLGDVEMFHEFRRGMGEELLVGAWQEALCPAFYFNEGFRA